MWTKRKSAQRVIPGVIALTLVVSSAALAGKAEREYMKEIVAPAMKAASKAYKTSCGCSLTIVADPAFASKDEMGVIRSTANSVEKGVKKHCSDKPSRAAACKMKTLKIWKAKKKGDATFSFSGSTGTALSDGSQFIDWEQMMEKVDP